ncbi:MAG: hypothetical protein L6437_02585 [Kiritimatiellae bacterium]|nr:hypothetical protein [Kiritimatiellia bacterium]
MTLNQSERNWIKTANKMTETDWLTLINLINPTAVRVHVACIVYWDYLHLEKYTRIYKPTVKTQENDMCQALILIGYPGRIAAQRVKSLRGQLRGRLRG